MSYIPLVSYEFYTDEYSLPEPHISADMWPALERRAWAQVNWRRIDIKTLRDDDGKLPEPLMMAVCSVADVLFEHVNAPKAGDGISERNFNTGFTLKDTKADSEFRSEVRAAIAEYLANTEWHNLFVAVSIH